jgi:hypothetical protein
MRNDIFVDGDPLEDPHWRKTPKAKRSSRHMGCPLPWFVWMLPLVKSKDQLAMALYLYRRCCICKSDTITVPNNEITELLDFSGWGKYRALLALEKAGVLRREENGGRTTRIRLCSWPDPPIR